MSVTPTRAAAQSLPTMIRLGAMMAGASTVDALSASLLPITARHFTDSVWLIGVMVAANRVCGFLVQPYAAWKSDRLPGRRGALLRVAWPATLVSVGVLGALPMLVPAEYATTLAAVALLFLVNLALQVFLDICYGSGDPLYGDTFVAGEIGRANGVRMIASTLATFAMTCVFVPLADRHEFYPYLGAMVFVAVSWVVAKRYLRERAPAALPPRERYAPWRPLAELRDPQTRNVAIVASAVLVSHALTEMLHALFVTETLGLSMTALGWTMTGSLVLGLACAYPIGMLIDRCGARAVLAVGFVLLALVELAFVFWVKDIVTLTACLVGFKIAWVSVHLPVLPLLFHNTPPARRGSIFAAVQMTRAGVTSVATILTGFLATMVSSYRVCYFVAALVGVVGVIWAMRLSRVDRWPTPQPA